MARVKYTKNISIILGTQYGGIMKKTDNITLDLTLDW